MMNKPRPSILDILDDYVCVSGYPKLLCTYNVSPADPDKEFCQQHLNEHIYQLEMDLDEALKELLRYREAGRTS